LTQNVDDASLFNDLKVM